jgi:hypothetical protein
MSIKNSNGTIGNQTRDVPLCSTVPQPTTPLQIKRNKNGILRWNLLSIAPETLQFKENPPK